ncbi:MAG: phosphoribosylformylglycinamidine synthase, partial [Candidatus Eisenbacteria sp.]|nr:phosphoribosylformylglycinamidine synthase [Candidatus Eisenbacteria bacterium]
VGMAIAVDGNPFLAALSPYEAGAAAVAEAVRNVAAVGAVPIALTDCLNFGNPEIAEVFQDFVDAVRGIGDVARGIGMKDSDEPIPIISGNVSFYNQSSAGNAILPSPIVCAVGRVSDIARHATLGMKSTDSRLLLVGERHGELGASAFMRTVAGGVGAGPPHVRSDEERAMMGAVTDLIEAGLVRACHDISDGGMVVALAEMLLGSAPDIEVGADISLGAVVAERTGRASVGGGVSDSGGRVVDALAACELLFCENGGYLLEIGPADTERAIAVLAKRGAWHAEIGRTTAASGLLVRGYGVGDVVMSEGAMSAAWLNGATEVMP